MLTDGILLDNMLKELHLSKTHISRVSMKITLQGIDLLLLIFILVSEAKRARINKQQIGIDVFHSHFSSHTN